MKVVLAIVAVMSMPVIGHTQSLSRLHVEGSGGVYIPNTFGVGDQELGWIGGARAGYQLRGGMRVVVHASYAEVDEFARIGTVNDFVVVGLRERLLTAGVDIPLGGVVRAEIGVGAVSTRTVVNREEGNPDPTFYPDGRGGDESDWSAASAAVPGLSIRFGRHVTLRARDLIILEDVMGRHNLSFTLGIGI